MPRIDKPAGGPARSPRCPLARRLGLAVAVAAALAGPARAGVVHRLSVAVDPAAGTLAAEDRLDLEGVPLDAVFGLHPGLGPEVLSPGARLEPAGTGGGEVAPERFRLVRDPGVDRVVLRYRGAIRHPLSGRADYGRGFRHTPGLISPDGVYLDGESFWYPRFDQGPVRFELAVDLPPGWDAVSQGARGSGGPGGPVRWSSAEPQTEIFLVAGPLVRYERPAGPVRAEAYLRTPDDALADRYLGAAASYLALYAGLIGPYPYPKFALVENFWETGWGMPSFTLLGSRILRFPFILHSSFPHEILHNWWGNAVYVDYGSGNWCEGLTAYLADHLVQEARGLGAAYRQATLQKYADYVARARDLPLTAFRARHSAATEAVGYGKALMVYHMVRQRVGDDAFVAGLRDLYRGFRLRTASWADVRDAFERASGADLSDAFGPWIERSGAPELRIESVRAGRGGHFVRLSLTQVQPGPAYRLLVPVAVTVEGREDAFQTVVDMDRRAGQWKLRVPARPLRVDVDPEFDLFRRLDPRESPPALSGAFGATRVVAVLPAAAPAPLRDAYRAVAEAWAAAGPGEWKIVDDLLVDGVPTDASVWVFGWENRLLPAVAGALEPAGVRLGPGGAAWGDTRVAPGTDGSAVLVVRHPADPAAVVAWLAASGPEPLPGLGRKLPHYHKYSHLAFRGDEPVNVDKGRWPVTDSPLVRILTGRPVARARLQPRHALATPPDPGETR